MSLTGAPLALALAVGAGLSTSIGALVVFFSRWVTTINKRFLASVLALSAGVMLMVSLTELWEEAVGGFHDAGFSRGSGLLATVGCFFGGCWLVVGLDRFVHSLEHATSIRGWLAHVGRGLFTLATCKRNAAAAQASAAAAAVGGFRPQGHVAVESGAPGLAFASRIQRISSSAEGLGTPAGTGTGIELAALAAGPAVGGGGSGTAAAPVSPSGQRSAPACAQAAGASPAPSSPDLASPSQAPAVEHTLFDVLSPEPGQPDRFGGSDGEEEGNGRHTVFDVLDQGGRGGGGSPDQAARKHGAGATNSGQGVGASEPGAARGSSGDGRSLVPSLRLSPRRESIRNMALVNDASRQAGLVGTLGEPLTSTSGAPSGSGTGSPGGQVAVSGRRGPRSSARLAEEDVTMPLSQRSGEGILHHHAGRHATPAHAGTTAAPRKAELDMELGHGHGSPSLVEGRLDRVAAGADGALPLGSSEEEGEQSDARLHKLGLLAALAICLHNFPEGVSTFSAALAAPEVGMVLAFAIALHNVFEGVVVAVPIYFASRSRCKAFLWGALSGVAEPIGALFAYAVIGNNPSQATLASIFGVVSGMMTWIALSELLPTARAYDPANRVTSISLGAGMLLMALSLVMFAYAPG